MKTKEYGKSSILKIEVSKNAIFIKAMKPNRRMVILLILALVLFAILLIAISQHDLQSKSFELALAVVELIVNILYKPGNSQ